MTRRVFIWRRVCIVSVSQVITQGTSSCVGAGRPRLALAFTRSKDHAATQYAIPVRIGAFVVAVGENVVALHLIASASKGLSGMSLATRDLESPHCRVEYGLLWRNAGPCFGPSAGTSCQSGRTRGHSG
jgi:hypothetical protein